MKRVRELTKAYDRRHPEIPVFTAKPAAQVTAEQWAKDINQALGSSHKRSWQV